MSRVAAPPPLHHEVPVDFICPITQEIMQDPVTTMDGHTYERAAIEQWMKRRVTSPLTNKPLGTCALTPNLTLRRAIAAYVETRPQIEQAWEAREQDMATLQQRVEQREKDLEALTAKHANSVPIGQVQALVDENDALRRGMDRARADADAATEAAIATTNVGSSTGSSSRLTSPPGGRAVPPLPPAPDTTGALSAAQAAAQAARTHLASAEAGHAALADESAAAAAVHKAALGREAKAREQTTQVEERVVGERDEVDALRRELAGSMVEFGMVADEDEAVALLGGLMDGSRQPKGNKQVQFVAAHAKLVASRADIRTAADQLTQAITATQAAASALTAAQGKVKAGEQAVVEARAAVRAKEDEVDSMQASIAEGEVARQWGWGMSGGRMDAREDKDLQVVGLVQGAMQELMAQHKDQMAAQAQAHQEQARAHADEMKAMRQQMADLRREMGEAAGGYEVGLLRRGIPAEHLRTAGVTSRLRATGATARECREGGFTAAECREGGYSAAECREGGYTLDDCRRLVVGNWLFTTWPNLTTHVCDFASATGTSFDEQGVLYWIGTGGRSHAYANPHDSGHVVAAMSTNASCDPKHLVQHDHGERGVSNYTRNTPNSDMSVDLGPGRRLVPDHYALRNDKHAGTHGWMLRHWQLQGSEDGTTWATLRTHANDSSLPKQSMAVAAWPLDASTVAGRSFRHYRILQTGKNARGDDLLCCAGMELYGSLAEAAE